MQRFKNIALVYPCDDSTIERVVLLARENEAKVTLLQVLKHDSVGEAILQIGSKSVRLHDLIEQEHQSNLEEVTNSFLAQGVTAENRLLEGDAATEIVRDVVENARDLVVMTAEGTLGFKERIFGSTSSQLMRKCPAPLLVTKPGENRAFQKILAAVDPILVGDSHDELNMQILQLSQSLTQRETHELHVAHAWVLPGESLVLGRGGLTNAAIAEIFDNESKRRLGLLKDVVRQSGVELYMPHVAKGEPAKVIPYLIQEIGIDLLVMGTVCRTGIPGFLIGNTAESVLGLVNCSVLVVKPKGFVTPVTCRTGSSEDV